MAKRTTIDMKFAGFWFELGALEEHLRLVEDQIERAKESESLTFKENEKKHCLSPDDADWHLMRDEYQQNVEFVFPFVLRGSVLISLYSMSELAITEIAGSIQRERGLEKSLDDVKGGSFLDRAKKYYSSQLGLKLCENNQTWERLQILTGLRNAVAHQNGRLAMVDKKRRKKIQAWINKGIGIDCYHGYIFVSEDFLKETFNVIQDYLKDLVQRYWAWDTTYKAS